MGAAEFDGAQIPLTVIVGTTQPWPEIAVCLDSLHAQANEAGAEALAVDGSGDGFPEDMAIRYPRVMRIRLPGASIFQMRAHALVRARGEVVAVTEDHCRVAPDWCRQIPAAHRDWPHAAVIGGIVENGAIGNLLDWACFFVANGSSMPPVPNGARDKVALQATVSYKKRVIPHEIPQRGYMDWMLHEDLHRRGQQLVSDDRIQVVHLQSLSFREACGIHFHDSRSIAGFRVMRIGTAERLLRLVVAGTAMGPLLLLRAVLPILQKRRKLGTLVLSLPLMFVLVTCRAAGAVVGFTMGEGRSPLRIR